jgi:hypothetical protein
MQSWSNSAAIPRLILIEFVADDANLEQIAGGAEGKNARETATTAFSPSWPLPGAHCDRRESLPAALVSRLPPR